MLSSARRPSRAGRNSIVAVLAALMLTAAFSTAATAGPGTPCPNNSCVLVFVKQPNTTQTNLLITDGYDSGGSPISVKITDRNSGATVDTNATVTLSLAYNPAGGSISAGTGSVAAESGVATFSSLKIGKAGPYKLRASSAVASNSPVTDQFMVSDKVEECAAPGCSFKETQAGNSYTLTPKTGKAGDAYVATLNLSGLNVSCDFAPYNYPAERQPNTVWYIYGGTSAKTNVIVIDKAVVQITPENGTSKYRVCYASPETFKDRFGNDAPADTSSGGPSEYFGTTWYMGLLPDCAKKSPVPPCVVSWTANSTGQRIGTFLTPPGDPSFR